MSWLNITFHFGLAPESYYVPVQRVGPPYGKAYGHYKKHEHDNKKVVLVDKEREKTEANSLPQIRRFNPLALFA